MRRQSSMKLKAPAFFIQFFIRKKGILQPTELRIQVYLYYNKEIYNSFAFIMNTKCTEK